MIELLVLASKPKGMAPSQRFRIEQWAPRLEAKHGIRLDLVPFESRELTKVLYESGRRVEKAVRILKDTWRRRHVLELAKKYDGVIIHREAALLGPAFYEKLLSRTGVPLFFDFDDAIWLQQKSANGIFARLHFYGKTGTICRLSRAVSAGNEYLADYARKWNPNVFVVPTSIELSRYPVQPLLTNDDPIVIGWSGSTHTLPHLETARPALEELARRRKIVLKVICNKPPERPIAGAENVFLPWKEEGEAEALGAVHLGIMPLPDDDFTRGKCGLKALQYMATGRPVVISPVGMNRELVRSGENGILATTVDEWVTALESLASSRSLREKMGAEGRRTVEERYSADVVAAQFADVVRRTLAASA